MAQLERLDDLVARRGPAGQRRERGRDLGVGERAGHRLYSTRARRRGTLGACRLPDIPEAPHRPTSSSTGRSGLTLTWPDGTDSQFGLEELRLQLPVRRVPGPARAGLDAWPTPGAPQPLTAPSAELVGAWGMQIRWNDGHETGIYAWSMLRACARPDDGDPTLAQASRT